jgi:hypothetical protein
MKKLDENERHDLVVDIITGLMQGGYLSGNATSLEGGVKMCESLVEIIGEHFPSKKKRDLSKAHAASRIAREIKKKKYHKRVLIQMEVCRQALLSNGIVPSWRKLAQVMNQSGFRTSQKKEFHGSTLVPIAEENGWTLENGQNLSSTKA